MEREARWALAVRILGVLALVLIVLAVLEAATIRRARAELQQLRTEREDVKAGVVTGWLKQPTDEFAEALRRLDEYWADPNEGLGKPAGLCADQRLDRAAVATFAVGKYLTARAAGRSVAAAITTMKEAVAKTDAYRAKHPERSGGLN